MPRPSDRKTCVFCGDNDMSDEDIIPVWMRPVLAITNITFSRVSSRGVI